MLRHSFGEAKRHRDQGARPHTGDVLVVTKLDRLARSVGDLSRIVDLLAEKGASLRVLNANIDTKTASGKAFLGMLGVFAEFETNLRRERQL
jgi:DNA invertase Pin-like site-specific DNA recombinase